MAKRSKNGKNKKSSNKKSLNSMKQEIANEFGVNLGPDSSSRSNGRVGGEITKRLVERSLKNSRNSK